MVALGCNIQTEAPLTQNKQSPEDRSIISMNCHPCCYYTGQACSLSVSCCYLFIFSPRPLTVCPSGEFFLSFSIFHLNFGISYCSSRYLTFFLSPLPFLPHHQLLNPGHNLITFISMFTFTISGFFLLLLLFLVFVLFFASLLSVQLIVLWYMA